MTSTNENGYVVYPASVGYMRLDAAKDAAAELSAELRNEPVRVEDCDTNATVARYCNGEEL
jgi:hypothetical protein